jgi:hypothetical protein
MTPEHVARLVERWVRFYTRNLPPPVARRRIDEIGADLHDHLAHERAGGTSDWRIGVGIAGRMVRGLAADASWRSQMIARHSTTKEPMKPSKPAHRSAVRVALVTAFVLLVPLVGMLFTDGVDWGVFDFVFAGALLAGTGLLLELAARRPRNVALRVAAGAIGVAAIALGEADDAPGLVLFGCLLIIGTVAMTVRTRWPARR